MQGRRGDHRPCRRDGRVVADRRRRELRVRAQLPGHRRDRRVAGRRPAAFGTRVVGVIVHLQARAGPVRRGRRPPARGARRSCGRRARERGLYEAARREAERATALLEFSRQLVERRGHGRGRRPHRRAARHATLGVAAASLWFQDAGDGGPRRATHGYSELDAGAASPDAVDRRAGGRSSPRGAVRRRRGTTTRRCTAQLDARRTLRDRAADAGRWPSRLHRGRRPRRTARSTSGSCASSRESRTRPSSHSTNAGNFAEPRADVPRDGRGARERARGERRVHVLARPLDHGLSLKVGEGLGLEGAQLKRLELGALFHDIGKIGIPETILSKPGPLTPTNARSSRCIPSSARRSSRRSTGSKRCGRSCVTVTSATTATAIPTGCRRGDPDRVADHPRLRRVPRDDDRPPVPQAALRRPRRCAGWRRRPGRSSTRASSRSACVCSLAARSDAIRSASPALR